MLQRRLLDGYQRTFPLVRRPFQAIARWEGVSEQQVIRALAQLQADGAVSRIGPVFRPNTVGASTLCAMEVASSRLNAVAALVNGFRGVNHNYEREHRFNLWFVITAPDREAVNGLVTDIRRRTGLAVLNLPLERAYHIDLGFPLSGGQRNAAGPAAPVAPKPQDVDAPAARRLVAAIQQGLAPVPRPFREVAVAAGDTEAGVLRRLGEWLDVGVLRRFGIVVRHRRMGYCANAMVVWDVPDAQVDGAGERVAEHAFVTLCYRRPRRLPDWPYNLFCMIHGRRRDTVLDQVQCLRHLPELAGAPGTVLFSRRGFKQHGALYGWPAEEERR